MVFPPHPTPHYPPHTHTSKHHLLSVVPEHSLMEWWWAQCCVGNPSCSNSCVNSQVFWSCHVLKTLSQSSPSQPLTLSSVPGCSWSLVGEGFLWTVTPRNKKWRPTCFQNIFLSLSPSGIITFPVGIFLSVLEDYFVYGSHTWSTKSTHSN